MTKVYFISGAWVALSLIALVFLRGAAKARKKEERDIAHQLLHEEAEKITMEAAPPTPRPAPHRPDWDEYFLLIAQAVASRGECVRSQVGAVIVRDRRIVATGYNGVKAGELSCLDGICPRANNDVPKGSLYTDDGFCVAAHAEDNAIQDALDRGLPVYGTTIYLTKEPCERCAAMLEHLEVRAVWRTGASL